MKHAMKLAAALTMATGIAVVLNACATGAGGNASGPIGAVVQTSQGAVRGETVSDAGSTAMIYRGIPYAAPPVGDLRWKAPQAAAKWDGVRDATKWPNRCPQGSSSMGVAGMATSEDCLYVNVVTAAKDAGDKLPVMVFFHGGGLTSGTGSSTTYNHPKLANQGVVSVTVNSRLGPIGYMAHPELTKEGPGSGNFGTMDLTASLEWVQANIAAFGGDPNKVTIFGESGGGFKVISQMASAPAKGLFDGAIVQSGSSLTSAPLATAEERGTALQAALGASDLAEMRKKTWEEVLAAGTKSNFRATIVSDGKVILAPVREQFEKGQHHKVPLIVGANAGEAMLRSSVPDMANLHSASGAPTWTYNFTHLPLGWRNEQGCVAFHGLELTYVFGAVPEGLKSPTTIGLARGGGCSMKTPAHDETDVKVAHEASLIWAQFAKTGNPSVPGLIDWPKYTQSNNVYLDIGSPMQAKSNIQGSYTAPPSGN